MMPTPTRDAALSTAAIEEIAAVLRRLLADVLALYVKTKGFHWHVTGRHFRDDHLLLDEQAGQVFAMIDAVAERTRKLGGRTLRSIADVSRLTAVMDTDRDDLAATEMFAQLLADNRQLTASLRAAHELCGEHRDLATASLIENWIDEAEQRMWFLAATLGQR